MVVGLIFGTLYFVMVPLALLFGLGSISVPKEFVGSGLIEIIYLEEFQFEIFVLLILIFTFLCSLVFIKDGRVIVNKFTAQFQCENDNLIKIGWFSLVLYAVLSVFIFVASGIYEGHWYHSRADYAADYGVLAVISVFFAMSLKVLFLCCQSTLYIKGAVTGLKYALLIFLIAAMDLYLTGNRIFSLQILVVVLFVLMLRKQWKLLMVLSVLAVPFGLMMNLFRYFRVKLHSNDIGYAYEFATDYSVDEGASNFIYNITESINMHVLLGIIKDFPAQVDLFYGVSMLKPLVFWIPRSYWESKPESIAVMIKEVYMPGIDTSLATTVYGEVFANFGFASPLLIPFILLGFWIVLRSSILDQNLRMFIGLVYGFTVIRMSYSDVVLTIAITGIMLAIYSRLLRFSINDMVGDKFKDATKNE